MDNLIKFKDIILNIINIFEQKKLGFGKTRIIKIAYLLEVIYYKNNRKRLTDADWIFYKYGPYPINYNDYLEHENISISDDDESFQSFKLIDKESLPEITPEITININSLIIEFGKLNLNKLLDYVYFETEPMIYAKPKQRLNFELIKSEFPEKLRISVNNKNKSKLKEIRKRMSNTLGSINKKDFSNIIISEDIFENSDIKI